MGRKTIEERFWPKVDRRGLDECWPWTGSVKGNGGYGVMSKPGESSGQGNLRAHRVSWALAHGVDPLVLDRNLKIRHTCDNPPCVNPKHLIIGTSQQNTDDMIERGRAWFQKSPGPDERRRRPYTKRKKVS